ncbi:cysteine desulfurase family protein [Homoserinibacter sp. YIM 151385]|uniref:cysteine desulfurase family protein n=1 Tax=Homoserinibacter sp. YIM 151385 TaxID=2985506 RepID=UPI0022F05451|nr:cysteine desulfurase family protein [Homoserinibacter sp. YIM 151385]WBU39136.1 cysteine desulfurase family protein [Homoserinibacter sp. YIM 151385]
MAVYLDHAATSPIRPEVLAAYTAALGVVGNPSSIHAAGQEARMLLEEGRERIARALGADAVEVVLTSGGTEAVNLGIKGLWWAALAADPRRRRILSTAAEHHAALDSVAWLERHEGAIVEHVPVDALGRMRLDALEAALAERGGEVALITMLHASNEVGTVQPVAEVAALAARHGIPVHVDAVASLGQLPIDFHALRVAALSVSAHKIGGPVGVGALLLARSAVVEPLLHGGSQQRGRSGTQDAAGAAAFGLAAELATASLPETAGRMAELRDRLVAGILASVPGAVLRGDPEAAGRLPGNAHLTFAGCEGDSLLFLLDGAGFAVSTGSACQAGVPEPSHVLLAMGVPEPEARGALRFTLGPETAEAEIEALLSALPPAVEQARRAGLAAARPLLGRRGELSAS